YEALSYVWGCQEPPRSLWLSGKNSGLLSIGPNLYDALERLRPVPGQEARTLWADQICINQTDLEERNAHVLMMGDIFKGARKVLIWLGQEVNTL
ncbi:heterokaryon incompatibility, partial [Lophium mytilinum]